MFGQTYVHYLRSHVFEHHITIGVHWHYVKINEFLIDGEIMAEFLLFFRWQTHHFWLNQTKSVISNPQFSIFSHIFPGEITHGSPIPWFNPCSIHPFTASPEAASPHLFAMSAMCQVQGVGPAHHPWRREFMENFQIFIDVSSSENLGV